jgi:hypothetical protein
MVAQYMAADHPTRVSALVVANSCVDSTAPVVVAAIDSWIEMFEKPNGPLLRLKAVWPQKSTAVLRGGRHTAQGLWQLAGEVQSRATAA